MAWLDGGWVVWTWVRCWCVGMCGGRGVCNEQAVPPEASALRRVGPLHRGEQDEGSMLRVQWSRGNVSHVSRGSREVGGAWRERRVKQFAGDMRVLQQFDGRAGFGGVQA